ncbi:MAG TPA: class I SAM-dependent methyltransferase, partial [Candidatus Dormibacteraeota bacterium]|nr:class I SAM-dependent methyltransferase [Candidatus Dormibacteraeota bacterium]
ELPEFPGMTLRDYRAWHDQYDNPASPLAERLRTVQGRLAELLDGAPPGPIRVISICAGQGRDVLAVLPRHPRRADVTVTLVELDSHNVHVARATASAEGLTSAEVVQGDASISDTYESSAPADVVLVCGIFGNISDADVENTVRTVSMLCKTSAAIMWTRHRREPDLTRRIRRWLGEAGFVEIGFDALDNQSRSGVGTARLVGPPESWRAGHRFFTFIR